jgi:hypothetical protein
MLEKNARNVRETDWGMDKCVQNITWKNNNREADVRSTGEAICHFWGDYIHYVIQYSLYVCFFVLCVFGMCFLFCLYRVLYCFVYCFSFCILCCMFLVSVFFFSCNCVFVLFCVFFLLLYIAASFLFFKTFYNKSPYSISWNHCFSS